MAAASSGCLMASWIDPSPRTARYSGRLRPAWRMNHTGVWAPSRPLAAASNGDEIVVDMARPTLSAARGDVPAADGPIELHDPLAGSPAGDEHSRSPQRTSGS